jgi:hypothetical protein
MARQQKFSVKLPPGLDDFEKQAIATEVIDRIIARTKEQNVDKDGKSFPKYSQEYIKSLEFRVAGKSSGDINLTLSGDMLNSLELLETKPKSIVIGFRKGTQENERAEGNILGSYGGDPNPRKARNFLGISDSELSQILELYEQNPSRANQINLISDASTEFVSGALDEEF